MAEGSGHRTNKPTRLIGVESAAPSAKQLADGAAFCENALKGRAHPVPPETCGRPRGYPGNVDPPLKKS